MMVMTAFLAFVGSSTMTASASSNIEMIIDDGTVLETRTRAYPSLQACLDDSNLLFAENIKLVKEALLAKKPMPKDFSVTCAQKVNKPSRKSYD